MGEPAGLQLLRAALRDPYICVHVCMQTLFGDHAWIDTRCLNIFW